MPARKFICKILDVTPASAIIDGEARIGQGVKLIPRGIRYDDTEYTAARYFGATFYDEGTARHLWSWACNHRHRSVGAARDCAAERLREEAAELRADLAEDRGEL